MSSIPARPPRSETLTRIKKVLRTNLKLRPEQDIPDEMPLMGGNLDLDSLDVLMLVTATEKEFGFKIANEAVGRSAFATVATLAQYVDDRLAASPAIPGVSAAPVSGAGLPGAGAGGKA